MTDRRKACVGCACGGQMAACGPAGEAGAAAPVGAKGPDSPADIWASWKGAGA